MTNYDRNGGSSSPDPFEALEYRTASPQAQYLSKITGFVARDIDTISRFCGATQLIIISRCPNVESYMHADKVKTGEFRMKPGFIKKKTGIQGVLMWGGRGYVSDYDLMCVHRIAQKSGKYEALDMNWDGRGTMTAIEQEIIGTLNRQLVFKIQHGCNDCYVRKWADGSKPEPKMKDIGDEFIVFRNNDVWAIFSKFDLKTKVYNRYGLSGWNSIYGC